jgi:hypothetical protein
LHKLKKDTQAKCDALTYKIKVLDENLDLRELYDVQQSALIEALIQRDPALQQIAQTQQDV